MSVPATPARSKAEVRRAALAARRAIPAEERREKSRRIARACRTLPAFASAPIICTFVSYRDEVETGDFIRELLAEGRRVAVPAHLHGEGHPMVFAELRSWSDLVPNHFGILQPPHAGLRIVPTASIPLFLVPGAAFDPAGRRVGYGLGFYDRALAEAAPGTVAAGLAFEVQVLERVPADPHDLPMTVVVTEDRLITPPPSGEGTPRRSHP
jgi:5-formyltetrahydrofolate cyclo-ligase